MTSNSNGSYACSKRSNQISCFRARAELPAGIGTKFSPPTFTALQSARCVFRAFPMSWLGAGYMEQKCGLGSEKSPSLWLWGISSLIFQNNACDWVCITGKFAGISTGNRGSNVMCVFDFPSWAVTETSAVHLKSLILLCIACPSIAAMLVIKCGSFSWNSLICRYSIHLEWHSPWILRPPPLLLLEINRERINK